MRMAQSTTCLPYFYNAPSIYISFLVLSARMLLANRLDEDPKPLTKPTNMLSFNKNPECILNSFFFSRLSTSYASKFCTLFLLIMRQKLGFRRLFWLFLFVFGGFFGLGLFPKIQGGGVDAVAEAGWRGAVFEDVAEMPVAAVADDFGSDCEEASVGLFADVVFLDWLPVTWPAGAGFVFGFGAEEGQVAGDAVVGSFFFVVPIEAGEGSFSSFSSNDSVLFLGEELFPF